MSLPLPLSVLLPTYNGTKYLDEQIRSILTQSYRNLTILAIDDGSSDDTPDLLRRWAGREPRLRVLASTGNRGQLARLDELVEASTSPLIAISDQDDVWKADKIERLVDALGPATAAFGRSDLIDGDGAAIGGTLLDRLLPVPKDGDRLTYLFKPVVSAHAMVVARSALARSALKRHHFFDQLIGLDSAFGEGIRYVPEAVTYHRLHDSNQCNGGAKNGIGRFHLLRQLMREVAVHRWLFLQRIEHLAFSTVVAETESRMFHRLMKDCTASWFDVSNPRPMRDGVLEERLKTSLEPYKGSESDWTYAKYSIETLTHKPHHPRSIFRTARAIWHG